MKKYCFKFQANLYLRKYIKCVLRAGIQIRSLASSLNATLLLLMSLARQGLTFIGPTCARPVCVLKWRDDFLRKRAAVLGRHLAVNHVYLALSGVQIARVKFEFMVPLTPIGAHAKIAPTSAILPTKPLRCARERARGLIIALAPPTTAAAVLRTFILVYLARE